MEQSADPYRTALLVLIAHADGEVLKTLETVLGPDAPEEIRRAIEEGLRRHREDWDALL
ncbi:hypothetical protein [Roseomonas elaeocarpi]|uniref:Uncharacterized protein n=1 Tax=Roseomonas elaeocarpi TaxID=907779 RepID=A0ABV6JQ19_9PROT